LGRCCSSRSTLFGRLAPPTPAATTSSRLSSLASDFSCWSSHWWSTPPGIPFRFPCQQPHVPVWECGVRSSQRLRPFLPNCSTTASSRHGLGSGRFQTLIPSLLSSFAAMRAHPAPCKRATTSFTRLDSSRPPDPIPIRSQYRWNPLHRGRCASAECARGARTEQFQDVVTINR
jgi:hypothetical protein